MSTNIVHDGYIETYPDGTCLAQLADLPGCFARGGSPDEAVGHLAAAIPAYYAWLARHDEYTPIVQGPFEVVPREVQQTTPEQGAFFAPDAAPVTVEDLDWYLALLSWAAEDAGAFASTTPTSVSGQPPVGGASTRTALLDAGMRLSRGLALLLDQPAPDVTGAADALGALRAAVTVSVQQLRASDNGQRSRIVERDGRRWSVRSVLRRAVLDVRMQLAAPEAV